MKPSFAPPAPAFHRLARRLTDRFVSAADVGLYVKHTKRLQAIVHKAADQLDKLKVQFDRAAGYKGDPERAKRTAEKINEVYRGALVAADTALLHAESAYNLAKKEGAPARLLTNSERMRAALASELKRAKEGTSGAPLAGVHAEGFAVTVKVDRVRELVSILMAVHADTNNLSLA